MEEIKIIELPEKQVISPTNHLLVEDEDGTKKVLAKHFKSLLVASLYFNSVEELKTSTSTILKEGDIVQTLGYYAPGDGGGAMYMINYNPAAVEDGGLVHYLSYSDTLRAEMILEDSVNVHQFGAVGDGKADDSNAIQSAIDNAASKIIEFGNNKTYIIRKPIAITKNGTIINGNGGTIYPYYCNGVDITPSSDTEPTVTDITINKLHVDCAKANNAIFVYRASKVDIMSCKVFNVTSAGINIKNSEFVNVSFCELIGEAGGSLIIIDGDNNAEASLMYSRFINILDCDFSNFFRAVHLLSTGSTGEINTLVNLDKCNYHSAIPTAYCVYVACPIEMLSIYANTTTEADTFLYFGGISKGDVTCRSISCLNTVRVFNIGATEGVLHLDGSIKVSPGTILFENMSGKLHSTVSWDLLPDGALFANKPNGEIHDAIHPYNYNEGKGYSIVDSKLVIREARNLHVDWSSSTNNLTEIENGVKGQLIYLKSSTKKNLLATADKIELSDTAIKLGPWKGVILRYDGLKWVQIQYKDSTILQTVYNDLQIDYSRIAFDTTEIVVPT